MRTLRLSGNTIDLCDRTAVALAVRLRASGVHGADDAATMLELRSGPTVWTTAEKRAVAAVVRTWIAREHDSGLDDELAALDRALDGELATASTAAGRAAR